MLQEIQTPLKPDLLAAMAKLKAARAERYRLLNAADSAWKEYSIFVDVDPRWQDPKCAYEKVAAYQRQLIQLGILAESAEEAAALAYQKLGSIEAHLFSLLEN
jgi:hypothetical protein